ncbi:MAG: ornithine carbamoyltransferase [Acidimicrobiales bacterium]
MSGLRAEDVGPELSGPGMIRHLLDVEDLSAEELGSVLDRAEEPDPSPVLARRGVALIFEHPSNRTRHSMEMAVVGLGGHPISVRGEEVGIDSRESAEDVARTLASYHAVIGARVRTHRTVERLAAGSPVPVINLLSDRSHPCQAIADLLTLRQHFGALEGLTIAYVGDFNNVARSLSGAASLAGASVRLGCPQGYGPSPDEERRLGVSVTQRPEEAVDGADVVYCDVWASMGQEAEAAAREKAFGGFRVDDALMAAASPEAVFLHCLPVHRGEEVTASVCDGPRSLIWALAENRLHAQRGLLLWLLDPGGGK